MKSGFLYEKLLFLAEQQEHWKDTRKLTSLLNEHGFLRAKGCGGRDYMVTVRNQIRFLGKLKGIFLKSRKERVSVP